MKCFDLKWFCNWQVLPSFLIIKIWKHDIHFAFLSALFNKKKCQTFDLRSFLTHSKSDIFSAIIERHQREILGFLKLAKVSTSSDLHELLTSLKVFWIDDVIIKIKTKPARLSQAWLPRTGTRWIQASRLRNSCPLEAGRWALGLGCFQISWHPFLKKRTEKNIILWYIIELIPTSQHFLAGTSQNREN